MPNITSLQKKIKRAEFKKIREESIKLNKEPIINEVEKVLREITGKSNTGMFVGIYWPLKDEIDLRCLKYQSSFNLALPASRQNKLLSYHPWLKKTLKKDFLKIPAPTTERSLNPEEILVLLLPAIAIDIFGCRLGYGGGYFDRLRSDPQWRSIPSFVVTPQKCVSYEPLPMDPWDIPINGWISEEGIFEIQNFSINS